MKPLSLAVLVSAALLGSGCSNVCDRSAGASESLDAKSGDCDLGEVFAKPSAEQRDANREACQEDLAACTEKDVETLNAFYDCLDRIPSCVAGQEASFLGGVTGCAFSLRELSSPCQEARRNN